MDSAICEKLVRCFHALCIIAAGALIFYWIYIFSLNEDLCIVDYKKYYESKSDLFPVLSLCLRNPFDEAKLKIQNPSLNATLYLKFLEGKYFHSDLMNINYRRITS